MPETLETAEIGGNGKNVKIAKNAKMLKLPKFKIKIHRFFILRFHCFRKFHFGIEISNVSKLCKWWRWGGGGAQAVLRASALF